MARCLGSLLLLLASVGAVAQFDHIAKLTASDGAADDWFGLAVSLSGDMALVGAGGNGDAGFGSGSAYIFEQNHGGPNAWGEVAKLTASDAAEGDWFGRAVSLSGDTALVGSLDDDAGFGSGSAYIFEQNHGGPNAWGEVAKLTASDAAARDSFGCAVSLSGDTALVGARGNSDAGFDSGSAYIFEQNHGGPNAWGEVAKLTASDAAEGDWFGGAVSLSGDTALVGAFLDDDGDRGSGSAYIFQRNQGGPNAWGEVAKLTASDGAAEDFFGHVVSLSGDTALVGARRDDDDGLDSGSAYIFERNQGGPNAWGEVAKLTASDGAIYVTFGSAVSLSGDTALVGAATDWRAGNHSGSAYIFKRNHGGPNVWGQVAKLTASDAAEYDYFGRAVSLSGDTALVGAWGDDDAGGYSGSAYIFRVPTSSPTVDSETTVAPTAAEEAAGLGMGAIVGIVAGALAAMAAAAFFVCKQSKPAGPATNDTEAGKVASVASDNPGYGL